jgi:hypothetical protein
MRCADDELRRSGRERGDDPQSTGFKAQEIELALQAVEFPFAKHPIPLYGQEWPHVSDGVAAVVSTN